MQHNIYLNLAIKGVCCETKTDGNFKFLEQKSHTSTIKYINEKRENY